MKKICKAFTVLLFTLLLVTSVFATINDSLFNPVWADTNSKSREIFYGSSATFSTGYFGTNLGQVKITATVNSKTDEKIVSYIVKDKVVSMSNGLGYEEFTVTPAHYKNSGEYIIVIKLKDSNSERVDSSLLLKVKNKWIINPHIPLPVNNHAPVMSDISPYTFTEGEKGTFAVFASDIDNDDVEYQAEVCVLNLWGCSYLNVNNDYVKEKLGASFKTESVVGIEYGVFTWTPDYGFVTHPDQEREVKLRFRANDDQKEYSEWQEVTVLVKDKNRVPDFTVKGETTIFENQILVLSLTGKDHDNDGLTYTYSGDHLPGAKLAKNGDYNAALLWKSDFNSSAKSPYTITITAKDGFGGESSETVTITVKDVSDEPDVPDEPLPGKPQCSDDVDNDNDGKKDLLDPGCSTPDDNDESDDPVNRTQCNDRLDNDGDTKIDYPEDLGCAREQDNDESDENLDNRGDNDGNRGDNRNNNDRQDDVSNDRGNDNTIGNEGGRADHNSSRNDTTAGDGRDDDKTAEDNNGGNTQPEPAAYANIKLKSVQLMEEFVAAGDFMVVNVNLRNNGKVSLKDVKIQAKVYDLGIYGSTGEFALAQEGGTSKNVYVFVPQDAEPGLYLVKVTVSDSYYHTSAYRLVFIRSR